MVARSAFLAMCVFSVVAGRAETATAATYTWNNSGTNTGTSSSWSPTGTPASGDLVQFKPDGSAPGSAVSDPTVNVNQSYSSLTIAPNQNLGGWTFSGSGTALTIGGSGSTGLTTYGSATTTFNGPTLAGSSSTNTIFLTVTNGSTLVLSGNSAVTGNQGNQAGSVNAVNINGGTLKLDNSGTNVAARLQSTGNISIGGSGTLELIGNSSATTTTTLGTLTTNIVGGLNTIKVTPNGNATTVKFTSVATFSLRPGTRASYAFEAGSGNLGDTNGAKVTFTGTPALGAGGLLSGVDGSTSQTVGFAIVRDGLGTNWATWTASTGVISVANSNSGATVTAASTASGLAGLSSTSIAQFNPAASTTITASGSVVAAALRITPTGSGSSLALGANALTTSALMLDGSNNFTITGTGTFGAGTTRYIYVNNPKTTLSMSQVVGSSTFSTVFAGPGFVDLTGITSQNTLSGTSRFVIAGGVVRGNNTQIGFGSSGAGIISLSGGVLEIKNGSNGNGSSADFTRSVGVVASNVTWGGGTTNEMGSGGFSAFGNNASVNLGGNASPTALTWNTGNFVGDGYALKFGSTKSDSTLRWLNPIALDSGTPGNYFVREVNVTLGTGGVADKTMFTGIISGSSSTDFLKTGTGVLELIAGNTYQGNTLIQGGTLVLGGTSASLGTTTSTAGNVIIGKGATFAGSGTYNGTATSTTTTGIYVNGGGTVRGGNPNVASDRYGTLTVNGSVTINSTSTDRGVLQFEASRSATNTATASLIQLTDGSLNIFNLNPGSGNKFAIDLAKTTGTTTSVAYNETYTVRLAQVGSSGAFRFNGTTFTATSGTNSDGVFTLDTDYVLTSSAFAFDSSVTKLQVTSDSSGSYLNLTFKPVPEPATVFAIAAGALGLGGLVRRRLRRKGRAK